MARCVETRGEGVTMIYYASDDVYDCEIDAASDLDALERARAWMRETIALVPHEFAEVEDGELFSLVAHVEREDGEDIGAGIVYARRVGGGVIKVL
jgi:hypothetical protein